MMRSMISTHEKRLENLPLNRVAFHRELPALLGISDVYARQIVNPPRTQSGEKYRAMRFPKPFFTSRSGVRVWWVSDLEKWASDVRRNRRQRYVAQIGSTLLDRPDVAEKLLGRSQ